MKIIVHPRQAGKTYKAVQWVLAGEQTDSYPFWTRVLLCHDIAAADYVRQHYPALDYRQVFSFEEWRAARLGPMRVEVAIDNADLILARMLRQHPALITLTGGVEG